MHKGDAIARRAHDEPAAGPRGLDQRPGAHVPNDRSAKNQEMKTRSEATKRGLPVTGPRCTRLDV